MNNKHQKTLQAIFTNLVPRTLAWQKVEALLVALDCELIEGRWFASGV